VGEADEVAELVQERRAPGVLAIHEAVPEIAPVGVQHDLSGHEDALTGRPDRDRKCQPTVGVAQR
jgi:hypothetical protein